jgi:large subunit ribosomal protein L16
MAMMPKRVKYRKSQKGRVKGNATRGNYVAFGDFGIQSLEPGRISAATIEAGRIVASQSVKAGGKLYIRIFPHKSITSIPAETRMGKGKGEVEYWAAIVKPGTVLYEIAGVSEEQARATFARVAHKLPVRCRFVARRPTL